MNPADAFELAIAQAPDDDALRLMYADWLDDQGDPRGELIRIQCALVRPNSAQHHTDLLDRQEALLTAHDAEWVGPLRGLGNHWKLQRGFVEVDLDLPSLLTRSEDWHPSPLVLQVRLTDSHTT